MNQENIPIKYTMNIWKSLPVYPTKMDVLFEIYSYLFKNSKTEFSEQTLNSIWYDSTGSGNWRGTSTELHFNELIRDNFKETKNVNGKSWFSIDQEKNPFL